MNTEPARIITRITAAVTATLGVFTAVGVLSTEIAGALNAALAAWIIVAGELIRNRVTPIGRASGPRFR